ncbi:protein-disulfide reductase DsbD [Pseudomonas sp. NCCP-436]|uniref:protein-disulfide reductase DsbD n=1 Tax=Pseudomonas sp. NCCP-436 TaxID=2842481 RepID=UPI001C80C800|nr:protein-disulfide reductase DsbD [Pseudomonas sp. NCCP-436]GIZ12972.1 thiol:disulfide interchange protein DsbD [Pseudomonas sp. NCCP-436]
MSLRRLLLPLLLLCLCLPASANLFDQRPGASPLGAPLNNSSDFLPVHEAFKPSLVAHDTQGVTLRFVAAEGYYLYRHRFSFTVEPAELMRGEALLPAGEPKHDEFFGDVEVYYGVLDIRLPLENPDDLPLRLQVGYQGCADKGLCYPPETELIEIGEVASVAGDSTAPPESGWSWKELTLFFLGGLALTFTPCVLPMLPILSGVVLRGQLGGMRGLTLSLAYVLAMAACFAVLGILMGLFGAGLNLQARLQSPWVLVPFAAFFAAFALAMFGLYDLRLPRLISEPLDRLAGRTPGGSHLNAALLGVFSSLLVSPCVSAPLAGALLYISASGDALGGGLKLLALGLGMGTPLVLFAVGGGAVLPKSGNWLIGVRNAFGVLLLAVSVWLLERVLPGSLSLALWALLAGGVAVFLGALEFGPKTNRQKLSQILGLALLVYALAAAVGALQGASDPLRPLSGFAVSQTKTGAAQNGAWQTLSDPAALDAALAQARAAGQPLVLDWYADWCISCKVIEREVFGNPEVGSRLDGWRLIRFDITESNAAQRALLDRFQLFGPPAILLFAKNGEELHELRTVGEIDAVSFAVRLDQAALSP